MLHNRFKIFCPSRRIKHVNNWGILVDKNETNKQKTIQLTQKNSRG